MKRIIPLAFFMALSFSSLCAITLEDALDSAAEYFVKKAVRIESHQALHILEIVNFHSQERDTLGRKIESELYHALERQLPDFKLLQGSGEDMNQEINLAGTYELKADVVELKLRVFKGKEILAQFQVDYQIETSVKRTLVAVLDVEAKNLDKSQRRAFSDVFRAYLNERDIFELASIADVDKLNPDVIQQSTGCTRDTCATIIGEQLGVDRVISTSLFQVTEEQYILSAKVMDIADGSILVSRTVEHNGMINDLNQALKELTEQLTVDPEQLIKADKSEITISRTLTEALEQAAAYFVKEAVRIESDQELHVDKVIHFISGKNDEIGRRIETEMYFALESQTPDFKLFLGEVKNKDREIILSGTYEKKAEKISVKFKITKGEEILSQYEIDYDAKAHRKTLVAVLDLEAEMLNEVQRKAFSEVLRATLSKIGIFEIASSADVDKLDPDAIQKETGCTRDTCATVIGEQLGVDRVVSSSFSKVGEGNYILAAKLIDIKDSTVLVAKTMEHSGKVAELKPAMESLAYQLSGKTELSEVQVEESSDLIWHIAAVALTLGAVLQAQSETASYNNLADENTQLQSQFESAISQAELATYRSQFEANQETMKQHEQNITLFNGLAALAIAWESYLLFFSSDSEDETTSESSENAWIPKVFVAPADHQSSSTATLSLTWNW